MLFVRKKRKGREKALSPYSCFFVLLASFAFFADHHSLFTIHYSLLTIHCHLPTIHYSLLFKHLLKPHPYILHNLRLRFRFRVNTVFLHQIAVFGYLVEHARYQWNAIAF